MKKNLMSVLILALVVVNLVLTAIIMISIVPQTKNSNKLIEQVCSAINLELQSGEVKDVSSLPVEQLDLYDLPDSLTINLKNSEDGSAHYAIINVSVYMDKEHEDYAAYGAGGKLAERQTLIENEINNTVRLYTLEEVTSNQEDVQDEIARNLQKLFDSEFIVGVGFSKITCQ